MGKRETDGKWEILLSALIFGIGIVCLSAAPVAIFRSIGLGGGADRTKAGGEWEEERVWHFDPITVEDAGEPLWEKTWGEDENAETLVFLYDNFPQRQYLELPDGAVCLADVDTMHLNNVWFSVPDGGTRGIGSPVFSSELLTESQWEAVREWEERNTISAWQEEEFRRKISLAREMIREGCLQDELESYLKQYPEMNPDEREWKLEYVDGGWTDRMDDGIRWCDLRYRLTTLTEEGETVAAGWLEVHQTGLVSDRTTGSEVSCRIDADGRGIRRLLEEDTADRGKIWLDMVPGENFTDEQAARAFVEREGAALLLPRGAVGTVNWEYGREAGYWYDYLICRGTAGDYDLAIAVPLMPEGSGGWYAASRVRRAAEDKDACACALSAVMQTLRTAPYVYLVRDGDTLTAVARKYIRTERPEEAVYYIARRSGIKNPDLIYPGQRIVLPEDSTGKDWRADPGPAEK